MSMRAVGPAGELRLGYQVAARLGSWTFQEDRVEAAVEDANEFFLDQPGAKSLWLRMGRKYWVWQTVDVVDAGRPMVVRVSGSPEVREPR